MVNSSHQPIVLVCAADDNYAMPLAVTVYSALANLKNKQKKVVLFIIDGGIKPATKRRITESIDSIGLEQLEISWVRPNESLIENLTLVRHFTIAVYYRLLIPQIIPKHFDKVIYLDSDLVVQGDLEQLWNIDMGDNYVLAVQDYTQWYVSMAVGLRNYQERGINPDYKYFNSGVLVINLEKWRSDNIPSKVVEYIEQNKDYVRDCDQDGLNVVLAEKWGELDRRWNQMPRIYTYPSWQDSPYDEELYKEILHHSHIVHFTNYPKPWQRGCEHPNTALFFQYLDRTAWSGWRITLWRHAWIKVKKGTKKLWKFGKNLTKVIQESSGSGRAPQLAKDV